MRRDTLLACTFIVCLPLSGRLLPSISLLRGAAGLKAAQAPAQGRFHTHDASDKVHVELPRSPLVLGQTFDLRVHIDGVGPQTIFVDQVVHPDKPSVPERIAGSEGSVSVHQTAAGDVSVPITPLRLHKVHFILYGMFPDGGLFHQDVAVFVELPARVPSRLWIASAHSGPWAQFVFSLEHPSGNTLIPTVTYEGIAGPVKLDAIDVRFEIIAPPNQHVISLDPQTGSMRPLQLGHVLVKTYFGGASVTSCVFVVEKQADTSFVHRDCSDLLDSDEKNPNSR